MEKRDLALDLKSAWWKGPPDRATCGSSKVAIRMMTAPVEGCDGHEGRVEEA